MENFSLNKDQYDVSGTDSYNALGRSNSYLVYFSFVCQLGGKKEGKAKIWRERGGEERGKGQGGNRRQREGKGMEREGREREERTQTGRERKVGGRPLAWSTCLRQLWFPGVGLF